MAQISCHLCSVPSLKLTPDLGPLMLHFFDLHMESVSIEYSFRILAAAAKLRESMRQRLDDSAITTHDGELSCHPKDNAEKWEAALTDDNVHEFQGPEDEESGENQDQTQFHDSSSFIASETKPEQHETQEEGCCIELLPDSATTQDISDVPLDDANISTEDKPPELFASKSKKLHASN